MNLSKRAKVYTALRITILTALAVMIPTLLSLYTKHESPNDGSEDAIHLAFVIPIIILELANIISFIAAVQIPIHGPATQALLMPAPQPENAHTTPAHELRNASAFCSVFFDVMVNLSIPIYTNFAARQDPKDSETLGLLASCFVYNCWKIAPMLKAYKQQRDARIEAEQRHEMAAV